MDRVVITEESVLRALPEGNYVKISYIIKALGLTDISEARYLENTLKTLVQRGKVEQEMQEGKSFYKRRK
ncbi:MAG: hypothetical protein JW839_10975 [Candidatus Lokiarchaeota archaeon]|nr:hypothetical protein [Candidatus Lokiarchaeota archaeon]